MLVLVAQDSLLADDLRFSDVNRIVALSDIHGAYDPFVVTLQHAGVVDKTLAWSGGETHLVITGDLLDRGADSRRLMDLIMRLETEAPAAGGRVHLTLGNHEVMNLVGDLRYVADEEFAAFTAEESALEREQWFQVFLQHDQPDGTPEPEARAAFDKEAPPGYFGHRKAFGPGGIYARWLLEKPFLIVINDIAFVHGGIPPFVLERGLAGANESLQADLRQFHAARATLERNGILSPIHAFKKLPILLVNRLDAGLIDRENLVPAETAFRLTGSPLHGPDGPLWYRGNSLCNTFTESDPLTAALESIGAARVVIGHTTTQTRQIQQRLDGQVIEINTGILEPVYKGKGFALIIENGEISIVGEQGEMGLAPVSPPRRVGDTDRELDDDELTEVLKTGEVTTTSVAGTNWSLVPVTTNDASVFAYFNALSAPTASAPELAAYRLDRIIGLDMVPVTVRRQVDGQEGTLQFVPATAVNERQRLTDDEEEYPTCAFDQQRNSMRVFDALIGNPNRTPLSILYDPDDWQLILVGHRNAFGTADVTPPDDDGVTYDIGRRWREALLELDEETLQAELGDVLDQHAIDALIMRRDTLLGN